MGVALCVWQLGNTGLIDETPPLFAAAARAMSETGDWLTPRVNGLPRFDKPPLVYWLMGLFYSIPGQEVWDPLGTWSARLPSALATVVMMLLLGDTVMRWPHQEDFTPRRTGLITAISFAISPLVMIWSRIAVSDALLCCTLGVSLLLHWRCYVSSSSKSIDWTFGWIVLGLAVLTKGPVAIILAAMTFGLFALSQNAFGRVFERLRPIPGLLITGLISIPWYLLELIVEGKPFWDSFFGYHNFQRFTSVVNSHDEPWWFFGLMLLVASIPFTPFLLAGISNALIDSFRPKELKSNSSNSLPIFAACWLLSVLILFTCAATKLPSYWLPATPAASLLIGFACINTKKKSWQSLVIWGGSILLALTFAIILWASPFWLLSINDPEIPNFGPELLSSGLALRAAFFLTLSAFLGIIFALRSIPGKLLLMQLPLALFQLFFLVPMLSLADRLRQLPVRQVANLLVQSQKPFEPLVMVGAMKPSMHFYTKQIVVYEGRSTGALVNLSDRLRSEERRGWKGRPIFGPNGSKTALVVIDKSTTERSHWKGLSYKVLGEFGIYKVWRLDRKSLERRANKLIKKGFQPTWKIPRPERF